MIMYSRGSDNMNKISTVSERLQILMLETGYRAVDICKGTGISKSAFSMYLSRQNDPKGENLLKLADFFNVAPEWLQGYDVDKRKTIALPRGIQPLPKMVRKPRLGNVSCGVPLDSPQNFDGYDKVPENVDCDYTLKCSGDSMIGARIYDGDIVYIKQQPIVESGEIAVVLVNGNETLLKRVYIYPESVILQAENPAYPPLTFVKQEMDNVTIIGKAVGFFSYVRK